MNKEKNVGFCMETDKFKVVNDAWTPVLISFADSLSQSYILALKKPFKLVSWGPLMRVVDNVLRKQIIKNRVIQKVDPALVALAGAVGELTSGFVEVTEKTRGMVFNNAVNWLVKNRPTPLKVPISKSLKVLLRRKKKVGELSLAEKERLLQDRARKNLDRLFAKYFKPDFSPKERIEEKQKTEAAAP